MKSFVYTANPTRVIFGPGASSQLPRELSRQGLRAALILSTPYQVEDADRIKNLLGSEAVGVFSEAAMHTPIEVTEKALEVTRGLKADSIVSIGGGSTTGLGKALSIRTGLPHISIPTSYAGSEMTPHLGETAKGVKTTRSDSKILPATVIYDVDLTLTLPQTLSATSGVNAIAHAVEALYAPDTNPVIALFAKEGVRALASSLPIIGNDAKDRAARSQALYGAWLCGTCLGNTTMSLHHKLCHTLGGSFNLPHAETHTILLPHTLAYNSPVVPEVMRGLAEVLVDAEGDAINGLNGLLDRLGVKRALKDYGLKEEDIDKAAAIAVNNQYANPREVKQDKIRELIRRAWAGEPARADL
ncbi:probable maleylacetate reductase [Cephalotrichum gorgonifer]|uniref:Probable maleylacetate reductase n=1 Tax=Cephalotrichum gorgonifer TaxID=2041049 RepID=A0AAE8MN68_9PEZI|nr:probable maleylacetate reductase [Cephalotrichum gorgonifer]